MCSLLNHNVADNTLNFHAAYNIDPEYQKSYADHYARLNPWVPLWQAVESGTVLVTEKDCPARMFASTEFYNDWLLPQKDIEAAVGIKIDGGTREIIHLPMHYPLSRADAYGRAAAEVLTCIRDNLRRSVDLGRLLRKQSEDAMAGAALVERACCAAFVIDSDRHLREANQQAVEMFSAGSVAVLRRGSVCLGNARADNLFRDGVIALSRGWPTSMFRIPFCIEERNWQVSLAPLPTMSGATGGILSLFNARSMVLVFIRDLDSRLRAPSDFSPFALQYRLNSSRDCVLRTVGQGGFAC